ncbi:MAG: ATP-binding cassette domain-containing protein [Mycoplasmatales bacterium]
MGVIKLNNAKIGYQKKEVITIETLEISSEQNIILLGANGVGKTTLIKAFLGLANVQSGSINVKGSIAYFPVEILFTKHLTAKEFLKLVEITDAVKSETFYLIDKIYEEKINTFSMGQINRFLLFMTLNKQADFLIIDELLNAIDEETKKNILKVIEKRTGVILVTHDSSLYKDYLDEFEIIKL